jgi:hypothetical protein
MLHQALVDCSRGIILLPLGRVKSHIVKGSLTRDFQLLVFSRIIFPPDPEYPIKAISNFYENSLI